MLNPYSLLKFSIYMSLLFFAQSVASTARKTYDVQKIRVSEAVGDPDIEDNFYMLLIHKSQKNKHLKQVQKKYCTDYLTDGWALCFIRWISEVGVALIHPQDKSSEVLDTGITNIKFLGEKGEKLVKRALIRASCDPKYPEDTLAEHAGTFGITGKERCRNKQTKTKFTVSTEGMARRMVK
ncbi:MAG: hypothetical protein P1U34_11400 [Coxiellaceae bacterium]|nr:hypothetical protein [Coxiellaceae bacterium]